ncbi:MAG: Smr/MutS family protein [Thermonemataceae bacterium]|nr:Smr/MutS family protein [Thermonemataceae bacterium]
MNIGDKVRLLHNTEQGIITQIRGQIIEVEIEDGFSIPVHKSEVVLVSAEESRIFGKNTEKTQKAASKKSTESTIFAQKGLYVAFIAINDQKFSLYFINNTDWLLPFSFLQENKGLKAGLMEARSFIKLQEISLMQLEDSGNYTLQALYHKNSSFEPQQPFVKTLKFRAKQLKQSQDVPILQQKGYVFQIDQDFILQDIDIQKIEENICEKKIQAILPNKPPKEVDLHIDKICDDSHLLAKEAILQTQLAHFEKCLDSAIVHNLGEITFIHGIGNGTLKYEIQKYVSKHTGVAYFKDAQKEKFGYGATYIKLK